MNNEIVIGAIFFFLGLIPAYYFYVKSIRIKEPVYAIKNVRIIYDYHSGIPNLRVTYRKKKIKNLSFSIILFYNKGTETITQQDIDTINHVRIVANGDVKILDATIEKHNNPASNFNVALNNNQAIVNFDYINRNQGALILVTHTGKSDKDIELIGDIKGVSNISNTSKTTKYQDLAFRIADKIYDWAFARFLLRFLLVLLILFLIPTTIYLNSHPDFIRNLRNESPNIRFLLDYVPLVILIALTLFAISIERVYKKRYEFKAPKGLEY